MRFSIQDQIRNRTIQMGDNISKDIIDNIPKDIKAERQFYLVTDNQQPFNKEANNKAIAGMAEELVAAVLHCHTAIEYHYQKLQSANSSDNQLNKDYNIIKQVLNDTTNKLLGASNTTITNLLKGLEDKLLIAQTTKEKNILIDQVRLEYFKQVTKAWLKCFYTHDSLRDDSELMGRVEQQLNSDTFAKHWKQAPAHMQDVVTFDASINMWMHIANSGDRTAHNKKTWGEKSAAKTTKIIFNNDSKENNKESNKAIYEFTRVPSLANVDDDEACDIANIQSRILDIVKQGGEQVPATYNLLTSLNSGLFGAVDEIRSHQTKSAKRIFTATHNVNKDRSVDTLFLVQNIGINHHTSSIKDFPEARFLSDLAILRTLSKNGINAGYDTIAQKYLALVKVNSASSNYDFSALQKDIEAAKQNIKIRVLGDSLSDQAAIALAIIYKNNLHYNPDFGNITQVLSIFLQTHSQDPNIKIKTLFGCKSANERFECIARRVLALYAINSSQLTSNKTELNNAFTAFDINKSTSSLNDLERAICHIVSEHLNYSDLMQFSLSDQAALSKLVAIKDEKQLKQLKNVSKILGFSLGFCSLDLVFIFSLDLFLAFELHSIILTATAALSIIFFVISAVCFKTSNAKIAMIFLVLTILTCVGVFIPGLILNLGLFSGSAVIFGILSGVILAGLAACIIAVSNLFTNTSSSKTPQILMFSILLIGGVAASFILLEELAIILDQLMMANNIVALVPSLGFGLLITFFTLSLIMSAYVGYNASKGDLNTNHGILYENTFCNDHVNKTQPGSLFKSLKEEGCFNKNVANIDINRNILSN